MARRFRASLPVYCVTLRCVVGLRAVAVDRGSVWGVLCKGCASMKKPLPTSPYQGRSKKSVHERAVCWSVGGEACTEKMR